MDANYIRKILNSNFSRDDEVLSNDDAIKSNIKFGNGSLNTNNVKKPPNAKEAKSKKLSFNQNGGEFLNNKNFIKNPNDRKNIHKRPPLQYQKRSSSTNQFIPRGIAKSAHISLLYPPVKDEGLNKTQDKENGIVTKTPQNEEANSNEVENANGNGDQLVFPEYLQQSLEKFDEDIIKNFSATDDGDNICNENDSKSRNVGGGLYVNLDDLMVLEEKLFHILETFRYSKPSQKLCIEWWNFYIYSSLGGKIEHFFNNENSKKIVRHSSLLELIAIIITYEALKDTKILSSTLNLIRNLLYEIHQNFLVICDYLLSKVNSESYSNVWVNKIQNLILTKINKRLKKGDNVNILKNNNENIMSSFRNIFRVYSPNSCSSIKIEFGSIIYFVKNISKTSIKILNDFFRKRISNDFAKNGNKTQINFIIEEGDNLPSIPVPYLKEELYRGKSLTLVLDLDETLINFKINPDTSKGLLRMRPGLTEFLDILMEKYELVVFTAATQDYADPILDAIESEKNYFDARLYRQHAVIIDNDFVKDLSNLGRNLSKIIIIDNMPQNFKLQKDNGIFIKTFYGEDADDTALIDLIPILLQIAEKEAVDVRKELKSFKNEIFRKITTNLEKTEEEQENGA